MNQQGCVWVCVQMSTLICICIYVCIHVGVCVCVFYIHLSKCVGCVVAHIVCVRESKREE